MSSSRSRSHRRLATSFGSCPPRPGTGPRRPRRLQPAVPAGVPRVERILREAVIGRTFFVRIEAGQHLGPGDPLARTRTATAPRPLAAGRRPRPVTRARLHADAVRPAGRVRGSRGHSGSLGIESPDIFDAIYELPGDRCAPSIWTTWSRRSVAACASWAQKGRSVRYRRALPLGRGRGGSQTFDEEALFDTGRTYVARSSRSCPRFKENSPPARSSGPHVTERRSSACPGDVGRAGTPRRPKTTEAADASSDRRRPSPARGVTAERRRRRGGVTNESGEVQVGDSMVQGCPE